MHDAEPSPPPSRDELAEMYLEQLPYEPYPVQEEALLAWFTHPEGVLVCAPTGTGKTLIAEAAMFEALHTRKRAYYTTPLIALTEQKFQELQEAAERWGFSRDDVGLVTGNRRVNPDATILVVVAEILLNRLLHREAFDFADVSGVVMDEFHSFNDPERGIVWELSLTMLPKHVRLLLLSATVGNSGEFLGWLHKSHGRRLQLVQSEDRKVPLHFEWVGDLLLNQQLERMTEGDESDRRTPTLLFCFNRAECWTVAEQLKGRSLLASGQQKALAARLEEWDWKGGVGPKLRQLLLRGVGVHHAGLLPKFRRRVEELFQQKLLSVCVCTETLAAGINLPARSVVLTTLLKGPPGKKKVVDASSAKQMFGRAGRPQFDDRGYVYALAHEDDVKIARWKEQYDQIPEDTKDPNLIRAKKNLKRKMPTRRSNVQYWNEEQFQKLVASPPGKLASRGEIPWRLLAYLLEISPDVDRLRTFVRKRLLAPNQIENAQKRLDRMLLTLWSGGYIDLEPEPPQERPVPSRPPLPEELGEIPAAASEPESDDDFGVGLFDDGAPAGDSSKSSPKEQTPPEPEPTPMGSFGALLQEALESGESKSSAKKQKTAKKSEDRSAGPKRDDEPEYEPHKAFPTEELPKLLLFRSVNPLYGLFVTQHLGLADFPERIQILESVLELPRSILPQVRVPPPEELPPGPLARGYLDQQLIERGLATQEDIDPPPREEQLQGMFRERKWALPLADKLLMLFRHEYPHVRDVRTTPVWVVGDLLHFGGDFNKYISGRDLAKQEGLIFRHLLRMILLLGEFSQVAPPGIDHGQWRDELRDLSDQLTESCRGVDPESTEKTLESAQAADVVAGETGEIVVAESNAPDAGAQRVTPDEAGEPGASLDDTGEPGA